jgi:putative DNA primase/helicase
MENTQPILDVARDYLRRGWSPIPVPFRSKQPVIQAWQRLRIAEDELHQHFNGKPSNLGVLLGEPSRWLVDVDLDHPLAVALADQFLPSTPAVFGRAGKPRSHRLFRLKGPLKTKQFKTPTTSMLVEIRSTGAQTVFPPSIHETGEAIEWGEPGAEPATIEPDELLKAVKNLVDAVKVDLGLKEAPKKKRGTKKSTSASADIDTGLVSEGSRNVTLTSHAGKLRRLGLTESEIEDALQHVNERKCKPPLDKAEVSAIARSVANYPAGPDTESSELDEDGNVPLGSRDPESGRVVLSPKRTLPTASAYLKFFHGHPEAITLVSYLGQFLEWSQGCYRPLEDAALHHKLQRWLHGALRYIYIKQSDSLELVDFESNPSTIKSALESIRAHAFLPGNSAGPFWKSSFGDRPSPRELLACPSVLIHLPTGTRHKATPAFFTLNALDFDHDPAAPEPVEWLAFLNQLFGDDIEAIELLQEWFAYCLLADTSQQKILLIVGPKRSGKGTIARVLQNVVGAANVCGPTTSSLAGPFGLQPLLYKTLAIVSDARFHGEGISTVVERLLCISGEDLVTVDRKHMESVTTKLMTRFMFLSNELPRFTDASGALAGRFLILRLTQSFYGKEDHELTGRLLNELPGILNWSIQGWHRLQARGRFVQPASVADAVQELEDLGSPVKAFVNECCRLGAGARIDVTDLYGMWKEWCAEVGREHPGTAQVFGRDLRAAYPEIIVRRDGIRFYEGIACK